VAYRYLACRYLAVDRWNLSESSLNGDWRLIQGDQSPRQFTAEDIVVLLEDNAKDKARMEELERKLDE
jgi:hypothetical protein